MKKKKVLGLIMAAVMVMGTLAGCGNSSSPESSTESAGTENAGTAGTETAAGVIEINFPTYKSGENSAAPFFEAQVERFNQKYEGKYKINIEEVPQASYGEKMKQLAQQKKLPVIVHGTGSGEVDVQWFRDVAVANDMCYDLSEWLNNNQAVKDLCIDESLEYNTVDGKVVATPLIVTRPKSIFYNATLYQPEKPIHEMTMEEFLDSIGDNKIAFQTADNGWTTGLLLTALIANQEGGKELLNNSVEGMLMDFNQKPIVDSVAKIQELLQTKASSNTMGAAYADAANSFMSAQSAFIFNGTWMSSDFAEDSADKWSNGFKGSDVTADLFPGNVGIVTVQVHGDWIANTATDEEKELALAYFDFVNSQEELEAYMISDGGSAPNMTYSESFKEKQKETKVLSDISEATLPETEFVPNMLDIIPTSVAETEFGKLLPKLADGTLTPEQFCAELTKKAAEAQ